jgi:AcrR family transcriptional regulator
MKMATGKKKRLSRLERREIILEAALEHFAKVGFRGANLDEIASRSGVTKPVLYDHFASKEDLFLEALKRVRGELLFLGKEILEIKGEPEAQIRATVLGFFAFVQQKPASIRVLLSVARGEPALEAAATQIQDEVTAAILSLFQGLIRQKLTKGQTQQLYMQIEFIKQGMHSMAEWWPTHPHLSKEQLTDAVMSVAWNGLADTFGPRA